MGTTITFSEFPGIRITGTEIYSSFTYSKLDGWYGVEAGDLDFEKRPNQPGAYGPGKSNPEERAISIEGEFFAADRASGILARELLTELYNDGNPVTMTVTDDVRSTTRSVYTAKVDLPWTIHPEFDFALDFTAADPRRYGDASSTITPLALPGSGLDYPIDYPVDYGDVPIDGRLTVANPGSTETLATLTAYDGEILAGFDIVNVETGQLIQYIGPLTAGTTVVIDLASQMAFVNGDQPSGRYLGITQWWSTKKRSTTTIQFIARGPVTAGAPKLRADFRPAFY